MADTTPMFMVWDGNGRFWASDDGQGTIGGWVHDTETADWFGPDRDGAEQLAEKVGGHVISKTEAEAADMLALPKVVSAAVTETTEDAADLTELRDLFAAHAIAGIIAAHSADGQSLPEDERAARMAYDYADAMVRRRNRKV